jgi:hypothetical protein
MGGVIVGLALILAGAGELWLCWRGSQHRLAPGSWVGLPLRSARRDDEAWYVAHEAAAGPFGLCGGIAAVCGLGVLVNGLDVIGIVVAAVGAVTLVIGLAAAVAVARRAVAARPGPSELPDLGG